MQLISSKRNDVNILEIEHYIKEALTILNQTIFNRLLNLNMLIICKIVGDYEKISLTGYSLKNNSDNNSDYFDPSKEWKENKQYLIVPSKLNCSYDINKEYRWAVDYIDTKNTNFCIGSNRVCVCIGNVSDFKLELKIDKTKPFIGLSVFDTDNLNSVNHLSLPIEDLDSEVFVNNALNN